MQRSIAWMQRSGIQVFVEMMLALVFFVGKGLPTYSSM